MTELKPCPFCGGEAEPIVARVDESTKTYSVICTQCYTGIFRPRMKGMEWCAYRTENEAIDAWNKRTSCDTCAMYYPDDGCMAGLADGEVAK